MIPQAEPRTIAPLFAFIASAAALMVCNASTIEGRETVGAEAFIRYIYAPYVAGDTTVDLTGNAAPMIFDRRLTALIRRDRAQPPGEIGELDQDPICDCQDFDRLTLLAIKIDRQSADKSIVSVHLLNGRTTSTLKYSLIRFRRGWRVTDIATKDKPSLVAFLQAGTLHR